LPVARSERPDHRRIQEDTEMVVYRITGAARWPVEVYRRHGGRLVFVGAAASLDVARKRWGPK